MPTICIRHLAASWIFPLETHTLPHFFQPYKPPTTHYLTLPLAKWPFSVTVRFMEASSKRVTMSPLGTCAIRHSAKQLYSSKGLQPRRQLTLFQLINSHFSQRKNTRTAGKRFNLLIEARHPPLLDLKIRLCFD